MNKSTMLISVAALAVLAGCAGTDSTENIPAKDNAGLGTNAAPVAFTNDKGELLCPVMGSVIASEDKAVSYQDHDGKRYYFCCDGCPDAFKKDPAKYKDGKGMPKSDTM